MRQNSHLGLDRDPLVVAPHAVPFFRPDVSLNYFLGDFTHEFNIEGTKKIWPTLSASLGAVRMTAPAASATRFTFGVATGVKIFPWKRFGFTVRAEYLPIVMHANLQRLVCAGGCIVVLDGGIMNQFNLTIGPSFRF